MSEAMMKLAAQTDAVDLRKIGQISISKPKYISGRLMSHYCRTVAAQAMIDGIQSTYQGILLRNTLPRWDLLDGYEKEITDTAWIQPQNNVLYDQSDHTGYPIYNSGRDSRNDRKVILLYGVMNMRPDLPVYATRLYIRASDVKTRDIVDLTTLKHYNNIIFFQQPALYRKNDDMNIQVDLGPDARDHNDHLAILGITAESIGANYGNYY